MILIITHKTDFTADFVINKLNKNNIRFNRFNCEDLFINDYTLKFDNGFRYRLLGEQSFSSVWFRRTKHPVLSGLNYEDTLYLVGETDSFLKNLYCSISAKWLSNPYAVYNAENKLLQLQVAQQIGFTIPKTIITNSKTDLVNFYYSNNRNIIVKPLYQNRIDYKSKSAFIFTNKVPQHLIDNIEKYDLTPCIFQQNISKDYELRVTVVNHKVFSAAVYSQTDAATKDDWRKKKLNFYRKDIPDDIQSLCIQLTKQLGLEFGAIDLIKTIEGDYIFLEINPNGQWVWIETQTGLKISDEIINYLKNK